MVTQTTVGCICNCSGSEHGYCFNDHCNCQADYSGDYCQEMSPELQIGRHVTGQLCPDGFNYFHVNTFSTNNLVISVDQSASIGDCDIYVLAGEKPNRTHFDFSNTGMGNVSVITIPNPLVQTYYIGVFGFRECIYELWVNQNANCPLNCSGHGTCNTNGVCDCSEGWTGDVCNTPLIYLNSGNSAEGYTTLTTWVYYQFSANSQFATFQVLETSTSGQVWLYVSLNGYPTLQNYDSSETSNTNTFHQIEVKHTSQAARTYFVGVYGNPFISNNKNISYSIVAWAPNFN